MPLAIFLVTAAAGVWAAYDRQAALIKFGLILGAIALYYLFAGRPRASLWGEARLLSIFGFLLAAYFLLAYNWQTQPVKIAFINRIALGWISIRPALPLPAPDPDQVAGILAILAPFPFALLLRKRQLSWPSINRLPALKLALEGASLAVIALALFLAAEAGPWLSLGVVAGLWLWAAVCRMDANNRFVRFASRKGWSRRGVFISGLVLVALLGMLLVFNYPGGLLALGDTLPGLAQSRSRPELWYDTLKLIGDYPFTGGGLAAFPGLYSQYILWIPFLFIDSSHQLFLEVAVQQGVFGLLALVVILAGSLFLAIKTILTASSPGEQAGDEPEIESGSLLGGAILSGLLVLILHGLVEDALYGGVDVLFLFLLPGFAVASSPTPALRSGGLKPRRAVGLVAIALGFLVLAGSRPLLARWYANMGAVHMARVQLGDFPTGRFDDGRNLPALAQNKAVFERALRFDARERTASHRLGLIALAEALYLNGDFEEATAYLERAYQVDGADASVYNGIRKALGYTYVWSGEVERAMPLLANIPETKREMAHYIGWWQGHGRDDLARLSQQAMRSASDDSQDQ